MNYAPMQQMTMARHIARSAEQQIKDKTGIGISVMLYPGKDMLRSPAQMLKIVALALDMSPDCFRMKTRVREITELRFLGALLLRMNFPRMTLNEIAALFGGQDHSSIINGVARANDLIYTGDPRFVKKYNAALKSVNLWLSEACKATGSGMIPAGES
jgi:chromosomal replication initiation ATPase DnaA